MSKCVICNRRPEQTDDGHCNNCSAQIQAERRHRGSQTEKPVKFLTYRGHVVGLYPNGNKTLKARLLSRDPSNLPKGKTLDLNTYLPGFTRNEIKSFKRCVLQLANA